MEIAALVLIILLVLKRIEDLSSFKNDLFAVYFFDRILLSEIMSYDDTPISEKEMVKDYSKEFSFLRLLFSFKSLTIENFIPAQEIEHFKQVKSMKEVLDFTEEEIITEFCYA